VRDAVGSRSYPQGTGSYREYEYEETYEYLPEEESESRLLQKVGQAAMIVSGAALVALAAKRAWPSSNPQVQRLTERTSEALAAAPIETAVTINKPKAELYSFWRRFENLPQFMRHVEEVVDLGDRRSHWVGKSPIGFKVEWDAEILDEREGEYISWSSLPGSQIHNTGTVRFEDAPQGRGTVVRAIMEVGSVNPVGQAVGKALSSVTEQQVREDLRRFKHLMETGEIPTTDGQPAGHRSLINIRNPF